MTTNLEEERLLKNNKSCGCQQEVASHEAASFGAMSVWCLCSISQQNYTNFSNSDIETKRSFERLHCFEQKSSLSLSVSSSKRWSSQASFLINAIASQYDTFFVCWLDGLNQCAEGVYKCTHTYRISPPPPLPLPTANTAQTKQTLSLSYTHTHTQIHTSMHEH